MRPPMPTLGYQPKKSPFGKMVLAALLIGGASGAYYWGKHSNAPGAQTPVAPAPEGAVAGAPPAAVAAPLPQPAGALPQQPAAAAPQQVAMANAPAPAVAPPAPQGDGLLTASVRIDGPLETALRVATGADVGPALAQVVTRSLVWWVDVPQDLVRGDTLDVVYSLPPGEEPLVHAVRFVSGKRGRTFTAYRFKSDGEKYPRYYTPDGQELEMRLQNSPIDDYEQITSLLRDGRRHKGVDFKAAVGTPIKAPFTGVVTRKNWSWRANGNCLELQESGGRGRRALFLHLDEIPKSVKVGDRYAVGQVLAQSGNSGRSFAPHLHYQLEVGAEKRVLDPFDVHPTLRRKLTAAQLPALEAEVRKLDARMGAAAVAAQGGSGR